MNEHCVSLELARELKNAGWEKETEFWWIHNKIRDVWEIKYGLSECIKEHQESWEYYPTPLATEILEELPGNIKKIHCLIITKMSRQWKVGYHGKIVILDKCLPNASAKCWIYLVKNSIISRRSK